MDGDVRGGCARRRVRKPPAAFKSSDRNLGRNEAPPADGHAGVRIPLDFFVKLFFKICFLGPFLIYMCVCVFKLI